MKLQSITRYGRPRLLVLCLLPWAATAAATEFDPDTRFSCETAQWSGQSNFVDAPGPKTVAATGDPPEASAAAATAAAASAAATKKPTTCIECHSNAGYLMSAATPPNAPPEDGCASAPTRPHFLNAFVRAEFPESVHGKLGCVACHGGDDGAQVAERAHAGMRDANAICASCHGDIAERHATRLHGTLDGMAHALRLRSGDDNFTRLQPMWQADCATCHAACSDCHLTLPRAVGGGLLKGHAFLGTPPMAETCATCHGSRAGAEYLGQHEGIGADVHFESGMHCIACHKNDLHGDGVRYRNRWQVAQRAQCTDCHAALPNETDASHQKAHADVACQVCHAQPYQNCFSCHSGEQDGAYFRRAGNKTLDLKVGRNTAADYPHRIVTLRSNPVARHSFEYLGDDLLPRFDDYPTWKTAAPHNIRRVTRQNRSCAGCHEDPDLYLDADDLGADDAAANRDAILDR